MTTNVTYDVDVGVLRSYFPQVPMGSDDGEFHTLARIELLVSHASAQLNGVLIKVGLSPSDIGSDSTSVAYLQCQRIICGLVLRDIYNGLTTGFTPEEAEKLAAWAEDKMEAIEETPTILGQADTTIGPRVVTTVEEFGIATDQRAFTEYASTTPGDSKEVDW